MRFFLSGFPRRPISLKNNEEAAQICGLTGKQHSLIIRECLIIRGCASEIELKCATNSEHCSREIQSVMSLSLSLSTIVLSLSFHF